MTPDELGQFLDSKATSWSRELARYPTIRELLAKDGIDDDLYEWALSEVNLIAALLAHKAVLAEYNEAMAYDGIRKILRKRANRAIKKKIRDREANKGYLSFADVMHSRLYTHDAETRKRVTHHVTGNPADVIEQQQWTHHLIAQLPERQRTIVKLTRDHVDQRDIGASLGISQSTVSREFQKAVSTMIRMCEEVGKPMEYHTRRYAKRKGAEACKNLARA